jgi:hypothetical protein
MMTRGQEWNEWVKERGELMRRNVEIRQDLDAALSQVSRLKEQVKKLKKEVGK